MPRQSPFHIVLTRDEQDELEAIARKYTSPYRNVIRAKIVLLAAQGLTNDNIAARLDTLRQIVSKWRKRFALARFPGLEEQPRGGRPAFFPPSVVVQVKALACELPHRRGLPLSRLSLADIRQEVMAQGIVAQVRQRPYLGDGLDHERPGTSCQHPEEQSVFVTRGECEALIKVLSRRSPDCRPHNRDAEPLVRRTLLPQAKSPYTVSGERR